MSIFGLPSSRGSAVLASVVLAAAVGIVGVILSAVEPNMSNYAMVAATTQSQEPTKLNIPTGCYAGQVIKIATSPTGKPQVTTINCYNYSFKEYGSGILWGALSANYLTGPCVSLQNYIYIKEHPNDNTTLMYQIYQNGSCVVTNKQITMVNSSFTATKPIYQWRIFSSDCNNARADACVIETCKTEPSPQGTAVVMPQKCDKSAECDAEAAKKDGCSDLKKAFTQQGTASPSTPIADQIKQCSIDPGANASPQCKQLLSQCISTPSVCGNSLDTVTTAMCGLYPTTKGCESYAQALNTCPTGDASCIQANTAPQNISQQINCLASGYTDCTTKTPSSPLCPTGYTLYGPSASAPNGTCFGVSSAGAFESCAPGNCNPPATPSCPSGSTGTYPNCVTQSCPTGTMGTYPNCQPSNNGGLNQNPYQQRSPQQSPYTNNTSNNCYNNYTATTMVATQPCAQDQNTYMQQMNYYNQYLIPAYNQCIQQASYAQANNQCPQQCQRPQPPTQCYNQNQQQQQSPYGTGNNGQPCQQPQQQPDPSQCANGSFQPVTASNGCLTGWQCSQNACNSTPQRPDPSGCTSGTWNPIYANNNTTVTNQSSYGGQQNGCIIGWQCVNGNGTTGPQASLSCTPTTGDVGTTVTFNYTCTNATASTGSGFSTGNLMSGITTAVLATPPAGTNQATYTLACSNGNGNSAGASCAVQVANPKIVLVANPASVSSGNSTTIGWITNGMKACTVASPEDTNFTSFNANNTSINGVASTSPITKTTDYILTCTTLGGNTKIATTTVTLATSMNSFFEVALHFLHLG